jgi:hypothetical protein
MDSRTSIADLETTLDFTFAQEISYPNFQEQSIPEGVRGRHVRLIKVDTVFSKEHHNFETVHVDLSRIVNFDYGYHNGEGGETKPHELILYSDGKSKVESHAFGTVIGPMRDAEILLGVSRTAHSPRLGMAWAGMNAGNDVNLSAHGIEGMAFHQDSAIIGHTNGHLLYVSLVLEMV